MKNIDFKVNKVDADLINKIVERANAMAKKFNTTYPRLEISMDITATHRNGCPLKLAELLEADDFNFSHDVFGIRHHINRETGKLDGYFLPRYAASTPQSSAACARR